MTTRDIENLIEQWGSDPSPPVLADSWVRRRDSFELERATKAALRDRPDLGWVLAGRLAESRRPCSFLKRPEFRWIRAAVHFLLGEAKATRHLNDVELVGQALGLYKSDSIRPALNAALMTREANIENIGDAFKIQQDAFRKQPEVVEAYADLFFNALDRKDDVTYLQKILGGGRSDSFFVGRASLPSDEESLLAVGFNGTIAEVFRISGFARGEEEESEDELLKCVKRNVLKVGAKMLESPGVLKQALPAVASHAIDLVKKAQLEQSPSTEDTFPGDFGSMAREVLKWDAANLRTAIAEDINRSA